MPRQLPINRLSLRRFWFATANDKALLGTQSGAGFLGAVVLGLAIGYFVFWFRKVRLGKALQPLLGSMLIPFVTLLVLAY